MRKPNGGKTLKEGYFTSGQLQRAGQPGVANITIVYKKKSGSFGRDSGDSALFFRKRNENK